MTKLFWMACRMLLGIDVVQSAEFDFGVKSQVA